MNNVKNIALWISAIIGAYFAIVGIVSTFTKKVVEKEREQQTITASKNDIQKGKKTDSLIISKFDDLNFRFNNLSDTLKKIVEKQNLMISKQNKSDKAVIELYTLTGKVEALVKWWF
jgi:hypothetical protein